MPDREPIATRFFGFGGYASRVCYPIGAGLFHVAFRTVWRLRVYGRENVPRSGGLLFAANHASLADPPLVGACSPRTIHFMAKQELFDIPGFGWLIRQVNAFPLRRAERDVGAFKTAQRVLEAGKALIVFPEGRRQKEGRLGRAKPGVGMLAYLARCPVVPVYIHGTHRLARLPRLEVHFGAPLAPPGDKDYQAYSDGVMGAIQKLKEASVGPLDQKNL